MKTEETDSPSTVEDIPRRYYVKFWKRVQPTNPALDIDVGIIYWSDIQQKIVLGTLHNNYSSDIESLLPSAYTTGNRVWFSPTENPKEWVRNLHKAELPWGFHATQYGESVDEI